MLRLTPVEIDRFATLVADRVADKLANQPRLVDRHQLAKTVGLSVASIDRRLRDGDISCIRSGSRVLFDPTVAIAELASKGGPNDA